MGRERPRPCVRPRTGRHRGRRAPVSLTVLNALGATRKSREHVRSIGRGDKSGALAKFAGSETDVRAAAIDDCRAAPERGYWRRYEEDTRRSNHDSAA